jgi:arginine utilization protein RocB
MAENTGNTGTPNVTYNLVSVLYHALQAAETEDMYIRDAEQSGDQDLVQFFRDAKDRNRQVADRAKQLLGRQLAQQ